VQPANTSVDGHLACESTRELIVYNVDGVNISIFV